MTPIHQREGEIKDEISELDIMQMAVVVKPEKLAPYLYKLESLLEDICRKLDKLENPPVIQTSQWNGTAPDLNATTSNTPVLDCTVTPTDSKRK